MEEALQVPLSAAKYTKREKRRFLVLYPKKATPLKARLTEPEEKLLHFFFFFFEIPDQN